jgi:hypothetical protein
MLPYLTPERYRTMGLGTEDLDDEALRSIIMRASLAADRYCSVPMTPSRYSFRGGSVTGEEHHYRPGNGLDAMPTTTWWPRSTPLKTVTQLRAFVTNEHYVDFAADELFVTKDSIHIASIAGTQWSLYGAAVPVVGLPNPVVRIDYTYGYAFTSVDEVLEPTDGQTYRAQNQFWDDSTVTVEVDGVDQPTGWTPDRTEGTIVFTANQAADAVVTASYGYDLPTEVREKGMSGVRALKVGEISIERAGARRGEGSSAVAIRIPEEAAQLLDGLHFLTIR